MPHLAIAPPKWRHPEESNVVDECRFLSEQVWPDSDERHQRTWRGRRTTAMAAPRRHSPPADDARQADGPWTRSRGLRGFLRGWCPLPPSLSVYQTSGDRHSEERNEEIHDNQDNWIKGRSAGGSRRPQGRVRSVGGERRRGVRGRLPRRCQRGPARRLQEGPARDPGAPWPVRSRARSRDRG